MSYFYGPPMGDAEGDYPAISPARACRRYTPRSGYDFLATLTGRSVSEMHWWHDRIVELTAASWTIKGVRTITLREREQRWNQPNQGGSAA